jgi:hypothetical protein
MRSKRDVAVRRVLHFLEDRIYRPLFFIPFLPAIIVLEWHHKWTKKRQREDE